VLRREMRHRYFGFVEKHWREPPIPSGHAGEMDINYTVVLVCLRDGFRTRGRIMAFTWTALLDKITRHRISGGVHPPDHKELTAERPIRKVPAPGTVILPLSQHLGAPCRPVVGKGDRVYVGTLIADSDAYVSAPIHSSVSGTVVRVAPHPHPAGGEVESIFIENDGTEARDPGLKPLSWEDMEPAEIVRAIRSAGIVGLGGAAFPTHVKLSPPTDYPIDTVIINGAECEPFLTSDYRVMVERAEEVVTGLMIIMKAVGARRGIIAIEANKPLAIGRVSEVAHAYDLEVFTLPTRYPQGAEKVLINRVLGRQVPSGGLPMHVGVVVNNASTAQAIAYYFRTGLPLVRRVVTVTGSIVAKPSNILVPLGTTFGEAIKACGGLTGQASKVVMGGPMMGVAQYTLEVPVVKATSGILVFSSEEVDYEIPRAPVCIRCGRCLSVCPMRLVPTQLAKAAYVGDLEELERLDVVDCMECGSCAYTCPTKNQLVQLIRLGKAELAADGRKEKERAEQV